MVSEAVSDHSSKFMNSHSRSLLQLCVSVCMYVHMSQSKFQGGEWGKMLHPPKT